MRKSNAAQSFYGRLRAVLYFGIGVNKLREMSDKEGCKYVLWVGNKRMIKRKQLESYLSNTYSI